jgi:hypothetical protein
MEIPIQILFQIQIIFSIFEEISRNFSIFNQFTTPKTTLMNTQKKSSHNN